MRQAVVVEIGSGSAAECSRRILDALQAGSAGKFDRELLRAARVCAAIASRAGICTLERERAELLSALVSLLRVSLSRHQPCGVTEISLLGHLAAAA